MATFLLEVGTEELPVDFIDLAIAQWETIVRQSLAEHFLTSESIETYATPRRLALLVSGLPDKQSDREEEIKGPPKDVAFQNGKPTKAAAGFARKQGVNIEDLQLRETPKGEFVFVQKHIRARATPEILTECIPNWIQNTEGKRMMRWGDGDLKFSRPIRWLVALWDSTVLPVQLENGSETIVAKRSSYGHPVLHPDPIELHSAGEYVQKMRAAGVEVSLQRRRQSIETQVKVAAQQVGGEADLGENLLAEVTNLVEYPTAVVGQFDREFLELPPEIITTVMVTHQRYFPVKSTQNENTLLPYFITVSNGDPKKSDIIAAGNERVIRARLADGQFFYETDLRHSLENYAEQLKSVTFQEKLGDLQQKVDRMQTIADRIANQLSLSTDQRDLIHRAIWLCKADLVSQVVYEFPELQGIMGEKYARASGETEEVAKAIFEHYLPRSAGDDLPQTITGQVTGLSDRLDTLVSIFGLGMLPTGSSDPFALRRAATGIINVVWHANLSVDLYQLLRSAVNDFTENHADAAATTAEELFSQLQSFFNGRLRSLLVDEQGIDYDLVNAVLGEEDPEYSQRALEDIRDLHERASFLQKIRNNGTLAQIYETVNRSSRLAKQGELDRDTLDPKAAIDTHCFEKNSESAFYEALIEMLPKTEAAREQKNYQQLVDAIAEIIPIVSNFFDGEDSVLVMAEDDQIRRNRLNLLGLLRNHARVLADFGAIVKD
ncbi:glycine--tRNA ligase subunit beta [Geitlerinema sp. PCC 9228]|jgi:glycyl-tRNA synthetase beta chain|uniref:glycine--tRNA ligase subunit beta n=1 Tax=Geitlerinema sp. PCC 9228 TaxID=111611 RepID=UPI0008F9A099|nr:glycine--tRNA ligase subunit beta [Geitlerinema sp. PCC 9228]